MAVLAAPSDFTAGQQVTHTNLNAHVNSATFAAGAVDNSTTQLSGGAIIVKDAGITSAKLSSTTGTGAVVLANTPTLITPVLGVATGTSVALSGGVTAAAATISGTADIAGAATAASLALTGAMTGASAVVTGNLRSSGATSGIGYNTGAGGSVTQLVDKGTSVTLNKVCGRITMNNASLGDATTVSFVFNNSTIAATDIVLLGMFSSGITAGAYQYWADTIGVGSCQIHVRNVSGGSLSEAVGLNFAIIKGVSS